MSSPSNPVPISQMHLGDDEPAVASRFMFTVDGKEIGVFKSVSGLEMKVDSVPLVEGGQNHYTLQLPTRLSWPNVLFKGGLTQSNTLFEWMSKTSGVGFAGNNNKLERTTGAIIAMSYDGQPLREWSLQNVFPVRWKGPDFAVGSFVGLEEELEISHQGFTAKTY